MSSAYFVRRQAGEGEPPEGWTASKHSSEWWQMYREQGPAIAAFVLACETDEAVVLEYSS